MCNFVNDFPLDKSQTFEQAKQLADSRKWCETIDDDCIYSQISSPEFRLYQEVVLWK